MLYCVFTTPSQVSVHHIYPPFTLFYLPPPPFPMVSTILLSVYVFLFLPFTLEMFLKCLVVRLFLLNTETPESLWPSGEPGKGSDEG